MSLFASPRFLRLVMWADAASCAATGALQLALQPPLADLDGAAAFPADGNRSFLAGLCIGRSLDGASRAPAAHADRSGGSGNLGWALGCAVLVFGSGLALSAWGLSAAAQAVVVLVLADLQWAGCVPLAMRPGRRRSSRFE